jgi:peroxiredoxin (alkyl hydroperoxide reductase subunit C)
LLEDAGLCVRGVFLIDKAGIVHAEHRNHLPLGRNLTEVLRLVDALQFHEKSVASGTPEVCPASWTLGQKGMIPTPEEVVKFAQSGGLDQYVNLDKKSAKEQS